MNVSRLFFLCFPLFLLSSCRKEKDETAPEIVLNSPSASTSYSMPCTIHVSGTVTDNTALSALAINITDPDNQVAGSYSLSLDGTSQSFSHDFSINDVHLNSGAYYIRAQVTDASGNNKSAAVTVNVSAYPRMLEAVMILSGNTNSAALDIIDSGQISNLATYSFGINGFITNTWYQYYAVAPNDNSDVMAQAYSGGFNPLPSFSIGNSGTANYFTGLYYGRDSKQMWLTSADGSIRRFNNSGVADRSLQIQSGRTAELVLETDNQLIVEEVSSGGIHHLCSYLSSDGSLLNDQLIAFDVKAMHKKSNSLTYLWVESSGQGEFYTLNMNNYSLTHTATLPAGNLYAIEQVDADTYLIAHDQGILRYDASVPNYSLFHPNVVGVLQYDDLNSVVYSGQGNSLEAYSVLSGVSLGQLFTVDSIRYIRMLYNK